jgi:hypothetical protein
MVSIVLAMFVIMVLAGTVVLYVAFPHRGEDVPNAPWVGEAMRKGVEKLPTLDNQRQWEELETERQREHGRERQHSDL